MTTALTAFLPEVLPSVPSCPQPLAINAVRNTLRTLCERAPVWKNTPTAIDVVADQMEYPFVPASGTLVAGVEYAAHDDLEIFPKTEQQLDEMYANWRTDGSGDPKYYTQLSQRKIALVPTPAAASTGGLTLRVSLKPSSTATTVEDEIYDEWHEVVAHGALARLLVIPDKPWTNADEALFHAGLFEMGVLKAKKRAEDSYSRAHRTISYGGL
jgi:hypothetical protein